MFSYIASYMVIYMHGIKWQFGFTNAINKIASYMAKLKLGNMYIQIIIYMYACMHACTR